MIKRSPRTVNRATIQQRVQAKVDALQSTLEEMGLSRYPASPTAQEAITRADSTIIIGAGIGMQIQALARLVESFGIYVRFTPNAGTVTDGVAK